VLDRTTFAVIQHEHVNIRSIFFTGLASKVFDITRVVTDFLAVSLNRFSQKAVLASEQLDRVLQVPFSEGSECK
jgi:hypothetical protein